MTNDAKNRRCRACGQGTIQMEAKPGRTWPYKKLSLEIPADFLIPTCDHCGEQWLDPETANALDAILAPLYAKALAVRFHDVLRRLSPFLSQRGLERLLGLSQGYLSKVSSGQKTPSEALLTGLMLLALDPATRLKEAEQAWDSPHA